LRVMYKKIAVSGRDPQKIGKKEKNNMCGIIGVVAARDVTPILLEGLRRMEYRGYDSAGMVVLNDKVDFSVLRTVGKVEALAQSYQKTPIHGNIGLAHTRWATHGKPSEHNAHPIISSDHIAVVHNGIIENHEKLRAQLTTTGYVFKTETDTEVIAHLLADEMKQGHNLFAAIQRVVTQLEGVYALGIMCKNEPEHLFAVTMGCPLVIGVGKNEYFFASDYLALISETQDLMYLAEGDIAEIKQNSVHIYNNQGKTVERTVTRIDSTQDVGNKGSYLHFMQKEIFEQASAVTNTLQGRLGHDHVLIDSFGTTAADIFKKISTVHIVACGSSYHAGMIARYWLESLAGVACTVEVASEYRYRRVVVPKGTLLILISQSGETADTLAALKEARKAGYEGILAITNTPNSAIVRESDLVFLTRAGVEIGVASTKALLTQIVGLLLLTLALGQQRQLAKTEIARIVTELNHLPSRLQAVLNLDEPIKQLATRFVNKHSTLFLGRGPQFVVALEGALKLKELSYIHAEAYPAGELKHGPLALVDADMLLVALVSNDELLEKVKSNLQEVRARGGELLLFVDNKVNMQSSDGITVVPVPDAEGILAPIIYTIPLQLLAYHVAVLKGTDVDQPRNLAKSVTVE
jgi:glutamine---fructose-6-phosphate transaminase (isomerizing)